MKTIEEIIVEKEFNELTQEELTMIEELAENEQEYLAMRSLFTQMNTDVIPESQIVASAATKQSLDSIFMAKHPGIVQDWKREEPVQDDKIVPLYNKTWFRAAAVLLLFSGTSYYYLQNSDAFSNDEQIKGKRQVAMSSPIKAKDEVNSSTSAINNETNNSNPQSVTSKTALSWSSTVNESSTESLASEDVALSSFPSIEPATKAISGADKSKGLDADLYPNGITYESGIGIANGSTSGAIFASAENNDQLKDETSSDVSTAEMLDWIQTLY